jgi:hypothetical protein
MKTLKTFDAGVLIGEPQQLELFGSAHPVATYICHQIGDAACHAYIEAPSIETIGYVRNLLVHNCSGQTTSGPAWYDYLLGAATALNPLLLSQGSYWQSDRLASTLDWLVVQSDIDQVWRAIVISRDLAQSGVSNERPGQPEWGQELKEDNRAAR